jgi:hypothetical protein
MNGLCSEATVRHKGWYCEEDKVQMLEVEAWKPY